MSPTGTDAKLGEMEIVAAALTLGPRKTSTRTAKHNPAIRGLMEASFFEFSFNRPERGPSSAKNVIAELIAFARQG